MASVLTLPVSTASAKHIRFSAYKVREVLDLIRGQQAEAALGILENTNRGSAKTVKKILSSAIANATHAQGFEAMELFVLECYADEGMTIKRFRPRARGRASRIRKRTCHLTITLGRLTDEELVKLREKRNADLAAKRQRRVRAAQDKSSKKDSNETEILDEDIVLDQTDETPLVEDESQVVATDSEAEGEVDADLNETDEGSSQTESSETGADDTSIQESEEVVEDNNDDISDQHETADKDSGDTIDSDNAGEDK